MVVRKIFRFYLFESRVDFSLPHNIMSISECNNIAPIFRARPKIENQLFHSFLDPKQTKAKTLPYTNRLFLWGHRCFTDCTKLPKTSPHKTLPKNTHPLSQYLHRTRKPICGIFTHEIHPNHHNRLFHKTTMQAEQQQEQHQEHVGEHSMEEEEEVGVSEIV